MKTQPTIYRLAKPRPAICFHAAERWTNAILRVLDSEVDLRNLPMWAAYVGASTSALRTWCYAAHATPKASLDFARLLRAVVIAQQCQIWDLQNVLDVIDARTLERMMIRGEVAELMKRQIAPNVYEYLSCQRFIKDKTSRISLARALGLSTEIPS